MAPRARRPKLPRVPLEANVIALELGQIKNSLDEQLEAAARRLLVELRDELGLVKAQQIMEDTAKVAAHEAVRETFVSIGIDTSNPILAQNTFGSLRRLADKFDSDDFKSDLEYLRDLRQSMASIKKKMLLTVAGVITAMAMTAIWAGFLTYLKNGGTR